MRPFYRLLATALFPCMAENAMGANMRALTAQTGVLMHRLHMQRIKNAKSHNNSIGRHSSIKKFNQPSASRGAAVSRILAIK